MPDFIPVLIAAILGLIVMMLVFSGGFDFSATGRNISQSSRSIELGEDFSISYSVGENTVSEFGGEISNGLFSYSEQRSEFDIENIGDITEGTINLNTQKSNYYGNLMVYINGEEIYRGAPSIGDKGISFDSSILKSSNSINIIAETSGWKIWAPTIYIFDADVSVSYESRKSQTIEFDMTPSEINSLNRARLLVFGRRTGNENLEVRVNGVEIYTGIIPVFIDFATDRLQEGTNTIDLSAGPNTNYNITSSRIVLFYG
ncbi:MAG: hypothetical protein ABIE55_00160 [Candidatus Aenigmatarchaeota archaeon]